MVLVPKEPTTAMVNAGLCGCMDNDVTASVYRQMLAAAPSGVRVDDAMVERAKAGYLRADGQWTASNGARLPGRHTHAMRGALEAALAGGQKKG